MGWFKKEAKAFGREFKRQGSILLFGSAPKSHKRTSNIPRYTGAQKKYKKAQKWAKRNGYK